jgi:hypothetical protein
MATVSLGPGVDLIDRAIAPRSHQQHAIALEERQHEDRLAEDLRDEALRIDLVDRVSTSAG